MSKSLRLLFLEDTPEDAELAIAMLEEAGYSCVWERVERREDFLERLENSQYDLVFTDYSLPSFDGLSAVKLFIERGLDIPIIHISGTLGEDTAVESLKAGATDYVLKQQMFRLPHVVDRALHEKEEQRRARRLEDARRVSEDRLRIVTENARVGLVMVDRERRYTFANTAYAEILGLPSANIIGLRIADVLAPLYEDQIRPRLDSAFAGERVSYELHRSVPGGNRFYAVRYEPMKEGGVVSQVVVVITDITERKEAELERQRSEGRYRTLFDCAPDGILIADPQSYYLDVNDEMCRMLGYTRDELIGSHASDIVSLDEMQNIEPALIDINSGAGHSRVWQFRRKDGTRFAGEVIVTRMPDGNLLAVVRDITDRRRAENERRIVFEIIQGSITTPNLDEFLKLVHRSISQIVYSENCFVILHDQASGLVNFEFWADTHDPEPAPRPVGKGFSSYVLRTGQPLLLTAEKRKSLIENADAEQIGTYSPSWVGVPLRTPSRTIGVMVLQHYEIENAYSQSDLEFLTSVGDQIALAIERKRADEALGESEERYRDLVENAIDIIYTHDLEGRYTSVNRAAERITGYTNEEALKMNLVDSVAPEYLGKAREAIAAKLAGDEVTAYELEIFAKNGKRVAVEVNTRVLTENGVPVGIQGIARDITERKQLEGQLLQAQKMEAIGLLAGGIAHDFNNLLTAINGYSALSLRKLAVDDPIRHNIEEIRDAGERAAALTHQLLVFSRKQVLKPRVHNLNSVITEIEKMLRRIIKESVEFRTVLDPGLGNIRADPGQIEQVIVNLAVNARDAMPGGGTLTVETGNVYLDEDYVSHHIEVSPGPFIKMTVTDTGSGMDEHTRQRIFEPFFTTKDVGKGTGLGLSTVYGIVKQSGGDIMVHSEIGGGTTFEIYLPCVDENIQIPRWVEDAGEDYSGTETILLVEDDEIVRNLICEILTGHGYTILQAVSGKAALSVLESHKETVHLLLTDMIMPGISGGELRDRAVEMRPDVKVLFISGYTDDSLTQSGVMNPDAAFLEKPFTPDTLAQKVREVLDS